MQKKYVDGFVIPIKRKDLNAYKKMAALGCRLWMEHGALDYCECVGDDFIKHGLGFKKMCSIKADETIVFAFIIYKSKSHRNLVNKKVMNDPRMQGCMTEKMPFDMKKFATCGFKTLISAKS